MSSVLEIFCHQYLSNENSINTSISFSDVMIANLYVLLRQIILEFNIKEKKIQGGMKRMGE